MMALGRSSEYASKFWTNERKRGCNGIPGRDYF